MSHTVDAAAAWIYRGVWASVVALFRVPPEPPTLPSSGEMVHSIRPSAGYLRYLKLFFWIAFLPGDIVPFVIWLAISIAFLSPSSVHTLVPFLPKAELNAG